MKKSQKLENLYPKFTFNTDLPADSRQFPLTALIFTDKGT